MAKKKPETFFKTIRERVHFEEYLHEELIPKIAKEMNTTLRRSLYLTAGIKLPRNSSFASVFQTLYEYTIGLRVELEYPEYCELVDHWSARKLVERTNLAYLLHKEYDFFALFEKRAKANGWIGYDFPKFIEAHKREDRSYDPYL